MPVSLTDVANKAQVSIATVSNVLNGKRQTRISEPTRERVWSVARDLGYRPNPLARRLHGKQTMTLGFLVGTLQNPFFAGVARELDKAAAEKGYQVMLDTSFSEEWSYREHGTTSSWIIDGALIWARGELDVRHHLGEQASEMPIVYLGFEGDAAVEYIRFDLYDGARQMTEHLIASGYRKIACVAPDDFKHASDKRLRAYSDVCSAAGLPQEVIYYNTSGSLRRKALDLGESIATRSESERPDVLMCMDDITAIGVYNGLKRAGLRVPDDIGVAGFDGIEEGQCLDLPLTTVVCPAEVLAKAAIGLITQRLSAGDPGELRQVVIESVLSKGGTTR